MTGRNNILSLAAALAIILAFIGSTPEAGADARKSRIVLEFEPVCDTLDSLLRARTTVDNELELRSVMKRGKSLDFYFTVSLSDLPWTASDIKWFRSELRKRFPDQYRDMALGSIYSNRVDLNRLATPALGFKGMPSASAYRKSGHRTGASPLVEDMQKPEFHNGMDNMHIALWNSHGRYYEQSMERWEWQRPCLFQTVEDLFTQGFVIPFLVPMLENAGACVLLPKERDIQSNEVITDNDPCFTRTGDLPSRGTGEYTETGKWSDAGTGFADSLMTYGGLDNPFEMGTARMADCIPSSGKGRKASARWTPDIPERGEYAVYVSYKTLPNSTSSASYTVRHLGGESKFIVNQTMGGGTWIYLGTFLFDKGKEGHVCLDNTTPEGRKYTPGKVVTADAVRFGGGMGNITRKPCTDSTSAGETSGLPRYAEGARYWMQWAGVDSSVFSQNGQANDYMDDFMSRGAWVCWLSGGSDVNPDFQYPPAVLGERKSMRKGEGIPVDLALGFHTDAGSTPNDSTVGTLAIYSMRYENRRQYPDGENRLTSREYAGLVQSQAVRDIRATFNPEWNRRYLWDRSYSESRTTTVPTMLLELMSHQNFADMRYGLDPAFRFTVSRAVYKGMLKYLSNRYNRPYCVQPLPVNSLAVTLAGGEEKHLAEITWKATADTLEPTAVPEGYILYTRIDSGGFDNGVILKNLRKIHGRLSHTAEIEPGHIYSYRVTAYNSGGESFPSETLCCGIPADGAKISADTVLIVNNFTRVSAPVSFDTLEYAGFDNRIDSGVPYMKDCSFTGEMYQFRRDMPWTDDDNPGFGASYSDMAGKPVAGNTFDFAYKHGLSIMKAGHPFASAGASSFAADPTLREGYMAVDLICGKQVTVPSAPHATDRYRVFTPELQAALKEYTGKGGNVLVSGAYIGTDIWDRVYEVETDSTFRAGSIGFAEKTLGYKWITCFGSKKGEVKFSAAMPDSTSAAAAPAGRFSYNNSYDSMIYRVENPDGIAPAQATAGTFLKYADSSISAGIYYDAGKYKTVAIGFPLETIRQREYMDAIIEMTLKYFEQ